LEYLIYIKAGYGKSVTKMASEPQISYFIPAFTSRFSFPKVGKKIRLKCAIGGSSKIDLKQHDFTPPIVDFLLMT
jgi:hypothetical protein